MVCPRCGRDSTDGAVICRRCGAPLAIPEEPQPGPLDPTLDLDRRARHTLPGPPPPAAPRRPQAPGQGAAPTVPPVRPPVRPPPPAVKPPPPVPEFFAPPGTPPPRSAPAPGVHLPRQEHPPGYGGDEGDAVGFADLPDDEPPELAEPPMTSDADAAFAELTERMRAGLPPPPQTWRDVKPGERPALELFDPTPAPKRVELPLPPPPPAAPEPSAHPERRGREAAPDPSAHPERRGREAAPDPSAHPERRGREAAPDPSAHPERRGREAAPESKDERPHAPPPLPALTPVRPRPAPPRPTPRPAPRPPPDLDLPEAEVTSIEVHVRIPRPWRRAAAWAVDAVPFAALAGALAAALGGKGGGLEAIVELAMTRQAVALSLAGFLALLLFTYGTLSHALAGATFGKRLLGLRLVAADGGRPSLARCAVRSALVTVSLGLVGLGCLLALFTRTGRALHDLVARTWVVEAP